MHEGDRVNPENPQCSSRPGEVRHLELVVDFCWERRLEAGSIEGKEDAVFGAVPPGEAGSPARLAVSG